MTTISTGKCPVAHGFNAMADPYFVDPATYLKPFSDEHPVFFYEHMNAWIVTKRDDALEVLSDWRKYSSTANSEEIEIPEEYQHIISAELMRTMLLGSDPDGHTRHRAVSQMGFLAEDMDALEPEIEARAHRIIDAFENDGATDLITNYCLELTTQTLLAHMGLGYEHAEFLKQLRDDFFMVLSSAHEPFEEPLRSQVWARYVDSNLKLREIVEQRRESTDRDLISIMASQKNPDGSWALGADEIAIHLTEFASAGTDTTAQAMANAIIFLQANPETREEALVEPELWPRVFIETIRRRNSSTFTARLANVDTDISGVQIKAGDRILVSLTSANTDENFYPKPFEFDIHRPNLDDHLSFSTGRHKCLGNPLAKVQAPAGLRVLFERLPSLHVDDPEAVDFVKFALLPARRSLPVTWDVADVERTSKQSIRTLNLVVSERTVESDGVVSLTLAHPDGGELPKWKPGAHIDLHLPTQDENGDDVVRQYSLSGDPDDRQIYRVGVLREAGGKGGSIAVHDRVHEGDTITVSWPRNNFRFADAGAYLFIAGGIGITPILPMVRQAQASGKPWKLFYGGRTRGSMAFRQELAAYGENVELVPQDELGHIDLPGILERVQNDVLVYACGPAGLLDAAEANVEHWPANSLRIERFTPKEIVRDYADTAFDVEFADSDVTVTVNSEETILDAAERVGLTTISSCRTGTCGTCETRLIAGEADHRDSILTPDEQATNETMMICVSRAAPGCGKLVLDR